jgi:pimeloyl-ACP methyl ester carboxylesterase
MTRSCRAYGAILAMVSALGLVVTAPAQRVGAQDDPALPIVFVHGFTGSAQQYETQAMRFASNDYPNVVTGIDRTSSTPAVIYPMLDQFFDDLMAATGDDQVYVAAHSLGTSIMLGYLNSSPERAARVAKYVGIDGATSPTCPGGVECMGVWARGSTTRTLGANNVYLSDQGHTQSVGSKESFVAQYEFFTGHTPARTLVLPEPPGQVEIAGRALDFPANLGLAGSTLDVFDVDADTGARVRDRPLYTVAIGDDGNFGPLAVNGKRRYEFQITRQSDEGLRFQHFYFEPFCATTTSSGSTSRRSTPRCRRRSTGVLTRA